MRRHWLFFSAWTVLLVGVVAGGSYYATKTMDQTQIAEHPHATPAHYTVDQSMEAMAKNYEVVLVHSYLCGLKDEEQKPLPPESLAQVMTDYSGWEIVAADPARLILLKRENDIAPSCKANGYFGLSMDGVLTLFNGLPAEREVIQTFYQINTVRMEASLSKEEVELLRRGIRVRDLAEYNSVLSTYADFQAGAEAQGH